MDFGFTIPDLLRVCMGWWETVCGDGWIVFSVWSKGGGAIGDCVGGVVVAIGGGEGGTVSG
ncbi:hypothetical protein COLO4_34304 [Corchorus olitorius]|uniref:Uncharacterized protein n=1 Tax=Corchorus olitorius TaxID=93759 RepID=A0A1R3GM70_9ROSI|nr:hypothetical protein COLO4_34304 [Corchorus olitorius]